MPYICCVPNCSSVSSKYKDVMFHKFPSAKDMQKKWLIAIRSGKRISKHTKVCSKHFTEDCYTITSMGQWKILKNTAIPSLQLPLRKFETLKTKSKRSERFARRMLKTNLGSGDQNQHSLHDMIELMPEQPQVEENDKPLQVPTEKKVSHTSVTRNVPVQTIITWNRAQLISHEFLSEKQLKHFTGFSRKLFTFFVATFGNSFNKVHPALSVDNELLIMLMKYRLNLYYSTLANFFHVNIRTIRRIVVGWTLHLYKHLKQIHFWNISSTSEKQYKVIMDCTEFRIERSSDPITQKATYSNYYGTNTFKVLVTCTENGEITFVSDVYGGSISDRKITVECGILDKIEKGQFVLADRGFDISDLLEEREIKLNIPPFKKSSQLSESDIMKTRAITNRRIIIENMIGLAKKNF